MGTGRSHWIGYGVVRQEVDMGQASETGLADPCDSLPPIRRVKVGHGHHRSEVVLLAQSALLGDRFPSASVQLASQEENHTVEQRSRLPCRKSSRPIAEA